MSHQTKKFLFYAGINKYLKGSSPRYLNPSARRSLSKILGCPTIKWDMNHPDTQSHRFLHNITALNDFWIRPLDDFDGSELTLSSHLYEELFRFLFLQYEIPEFLNIHLRKLLTYGHRGQLERTCLAWIVLLGQGASLKQAGRVIGWDIPKRFPHKLYEVPGEGLSLEQGIMWALTLSAGGHAMDCQRLMELCSRNVLYMLYKPGRVHFKKYWWNLTRWLTRNRLNIKDEQWTVIRRWLTHVNTEVLVGCMDFSWKHRTVNSVLQLAEDYLHVRIAVDEYGEVARVGPWERKGWDWTDQVSGMGECQIVELTSPEELVEDGEIQDHCVGMYAGRCCKGEAAIFSFRVNGTRALTIMVSMSTLNLQQVYGYCNREATEEEFSVVSRWFSLVKS